jgi:hypothetical protein
MGNAENSGKSVHNDRAGRQQEISKQRTRLVLLKLPLGYESSKTLAFSAEWMVNQEKLAVRKLSGAVHAHIRLNRICATNNSIRKELTMSIQTVARKFVELCSQGKNFDVMETMYAPTISPSTSPSKSRPKPPASGSRSKRSVSTRSRTTRSRASSSSTMASGNGTSHPIGSDRSNKPFFLLRRQP